ncbi:hypothetical protein M405DRAFT_804904 [Rhizopogon salebrosus TDB-379]|nr:hypothetical protein M405DRAFT_804904 [Rhizopogon salebrosus TDB-379]
MALSDQLEFVKDVVDQLNKNIDAPEAEARAVVQLVPGPHQQRTSLSYAIPRT